jgi:hypothetical protein
MTALSLVTPFADEVKIVEGITTAPKSPSKTFNTNANAPISSLLADIDFGGPPQ